MPENKYVQLSLSDIKPETKNTKEAKVAEKKKAVKATKPTITKKMEKLRDSLVNAHTYEAFLREFFKTTGDELRPEEEVTYHSLHTVYGVRGNSRFYLTGRHSSREFDERVKWLLYIDDAGNPWKMSIEIGYHYDRDAYASEMRVKKIGKWRPVNGLPTNYLLLGDKKIMPELLKKKNPWAYEYICEKVTKRRIIDACLKLLLAPQLEQLDKAGFAFARPLMEFTYSDDRIECFNRLTQPGGNLKSIFKTSKAVYETLKDEMDMKVWDVYRKMFKKGSITKECLKDLYETGAGDKELAQYHSILGTEINGKRPFTWESLQNYIQRVDTYQAIGLTECLQLLQDYLRTCKALEMDPVTDSDSLKREHDTAARTLRNKKDEIRAKKMEGACEFLKKYNYEEDLYFIRGVESYNDLLDEAKQQRNCVACYADGIASKRSYIYFMRAKKNPDRSLITVEVSSDGSKLKQAFYACNRAVRNKSQREFLERWIRNNKEVNKKTKGVA